MNVLVVEDEPISAKLATLVLSAAGYMVSDAEAAAEAIEAIKREKPDVILLDLKLPGADGLALARHLRQDPDTRDIVIIAVTAYPDQWPRRAAIKAGCDAYIVKPIATRTLGQEVADIAARKRP